MKAVILIILGMICYSFAQTGNATSCDQLTNCYTCALLKNTDGSNKCYWCQPANSNSVQGCFSLPNAGTCNTEDDATYTFNSLSSCPDNPCSGYESFQCTQCLADSRCGFCKDSSRCELGNSTQPFAGDCGTNSNWRYTSAATCNTFYPCSTMQDCQDCVNNKQDSATSCTWCGGFSNGKCATVSGNSGCNVTAITATASCPNQPNSSSTTIFSSLLFFFIAVFYMCL
eukprot:TRINITY_DN10492_c0_g1_i1.p1 TRINITY_DN10492_c0_g1~~TRINITY_DN10492_c0_g1_i1.p1  ORF type:complete len:228 (-),score=42.52 TRINITY_DN10492_c0_g1_i1:51-734(-)